MNKYKVLPCEEENCKETLRLTLWFYTYYHYGFAVCKKHLEELLQIIL